MADLAQRHVPAGHTLRGVTMRAGPRQGIDLDAMQIAWRAVMLARGHADGEVALHCTIDPWNCTCTGCGSRWTSDAPAESACPGGCEAAPTFAGNSDLQVINIDVDP